MNKSKKTIAQSSSGIMLTKRNKLRHRDPVAETNHSPVVTSDALTGSGGAGLDLLGLPNHASENFVLSLWAFHPYPSILLLGGRNSTSALPRFTLVGRHISGHLEVFAQCPELIVHERDLVSRPVAR
jgi:hypothetical protein